MKEDYEWEYLCRSLNGLVEWVESICTDEQLDTSVLSLGGGTGRDLLARIKAGPGDADKYSAWKRKAHRPGHDLRDGLGTRVTRDQPVSNVRGNESVS